jgi:hypothetical protein
VLRSFAPLVGDQTLRRRHTNASASAPARFLLNPYSGLFLAHGNSVQTVKPLRAPATAPSSVEYKAALPIEFKEKVIVTGLRCT